MRPRVFAAGVVFGGGLFAPVPDAAAQQLDVGGPGESVEVSVGISPSEQRVKVKARADLGDVEVGTIQADVRPRIGEPGDEPAVSQDSGSAPEQEGEGGETQVAPANIYAHPRVFSPGNDGDVEQRNASESQVAPVNADISPRIFSDGDSGKRTQRNGADEADAPQEEPPPEDPQTPVPVVGPIIDSRPRPGRRGAIDLVAVNADISPRIASAGNDGDRNQRNGYDGAGNADDEIGHDNQVAPVNAILAPRVLSNGSDGSVQQWNGSNDDQAAAATGGDAVTGAGDQVLTDNQLLPVNLLLATRILSDGDDGAVRQHNGSEDGQQAAVDNPPGNSGDAVTGGGDQVLTDDQIVPVNAVVAGDIGSAGNGGGVEQHNGSDDDERATAANGVGSDGDAQTGGGDETLTDLQVLPVNLLLAPDLGATGGDGPVIQHNGSDDDQEAHVTNAGATGGDGSTGSGDEVLADLQVVPVATALAPSLGSTGDDGATTQHNGSDDDQLVTVTNGVGADGDGTTGDGDQTIVDVAFTPVAADASPNLAGEGADGPATQHNGSDDDQEVRITNEAQTGGDGAAGGGDQTLADPQVVPTTTAVPGGGASAQQNGSDDDQLVVVDNGPGDGGTGTAGQGPQQGSDVTLVPLALTDPRNARGTGDGVMVIVRGRRASGGQPAAPADPERRRRDIERRRRERRDRLEQTSTTAGGAPRIEVKGVSASGRELPRTGSAPLPLAALGALMTAAGFAGRRRVREKDQ